MFTTIGIIARDILTITLCPAIGCLMDKSKQQKELSGDELMALYRKVAFKGLLWSEDPLGKPFKRGSTPDEDLFSVSVLAREMHRTVLALMHWDQNGILPCIYRDGARRRYYTPAQIAGLVEIAREEGLLNGGCPKVRSTSFPERAHAFFSAERARLRALRSVSGTSPPRRRSSAPISSSAALISCAG